MVEISSSTWLNSAYKKYLTEPNTNLSLSPRFQHKLTDYSDLGLINTQSLSQRGKIKRTSCSIKIGELISSRQRHSMITQVGIPTFLQSMKNSKRKEELSENYKQTCLSPSSVRKDFRKDSRVSGYIDSLCAKRSSKGKIREINPMFYKKINEVIEKSKKLMERCKGFGKEVKSIKRKSFGKLNKIDRMKIEASMRLII